MEKVECREEVCFFKDVKEEEVKNKVSHVCSRCIGNKYCEQPDGNYHTPKFENGY
jgi:hypothetical protein